MYKPKVPIEIYCKIHENKKFSRLHHTYIGFVNIYSGVQYMCSLLNHYIFVFKCNYNVVPTPYDICICLRKNIGR